MPQIWGDWEALGKVAWHHISGLFVLAQSLGTIKFTLFFLALGMIAASYKVPSEMGFLSLKY